MDRPSQKSARVAHILSQERSNSGNAGTAVSENYGNKAAGPSSSARFKRGGIVGPMDIDGKAPKPRMDKMPRRSGGSCMPKRAMGGIIDEPEPTGFARARMDNPRPPSVMGTGVTAEGPGPTRARALEDSLMRAVIADKLRESHMVDPEARMMGRKKGGVVEGSAKDMREDKAMAKKAGMGMKAWEKSAADKKHDRPKRAMGGTVMADEEVLDGPQDIPARGPGKGPMKADKGRKGATTVNVVIASQPPAAAPPMPLPVTGGPPVPAPKPPPMMAPGAPGGMPPGMPPMPMRKHGGRVMHAGAGSGVGRLEKIGK